MLNDMEILKLGDVKNGSIFFFMQEKFDDYAMFYGTQNYKTQLGIFDSIGALKDECFISDKNQLVAVLKYYEKLPYPHGTFGVGIKQVKSAEEEGN